MRWRGTIPACVFIAMLAACAAAAEQPEAKAGDGKPKDSFLRLLRDNSEVPVALETAIVRCAPVDSAKRTPTVDLVAAVHVADKSYYGQLNKEFEGYDAVLYELVAPEGTRVPKGGGKGSGNPVSMLQKGLKDVLQLEFQLEAIDYTRKNMVHADMSPQQFAQSMRNRGESFTAMFLRMMGYALAKAGQSQADGKATDLELIMALFDKNRTVALKRLLAEQLADMDGSLLAIEGPAGSTLISGRNKAALDVLRKETAAGKRKIAIFYGAGHMSDLRRRLRDDFGLAPVSTRWLVAWDLKGKPKEKRD